MTDPLWERYAELLVGYCTTVAPGDQVMLQVDTAALPLARAVTRAVLRAGGEPHLRLTYPEQGLDQIALATDDLLDSEPTVLLEEMKRMDVFIRVAAPENLRLLTDVGQERLARMARRMQPVQRQRLERTRWVTTLFPTAAAAQEAGMSTDAYERFVFGAMFLLDDDPAEAWRELGRRQQRWADRLSRADVLHIEGPGTDLHLRVGGRSWMNSDGKRNMPSGEVFTSPIEDSAQGTITFAVPSNVQGAVVEHVRLRFDRGKVVEATAARGQELLDARLATDPGARFLGEIGIGTNPHIRRPTFSTLYDEKILGTVHLALGRSYVETGGTNDSAIHWDLVCDLRSEGRVTADGETILENGALRD